MRLQALRRPCRNVPPRTARMVTISPLDGLRSAAPARSEAVSAASCSSRVAILQPMGPAGRRIPGSGLTGSVPQVRPPSCAPAPAMDTRRADRRWSAAHENSRAGWLRRRRPARHVSQRAGAPVFRVEVALRPEPDSAVTTPQAASGANRKPACSNTRAFQRSLDLALLLRVSSKLT